MNSINKFAQLQNGMTFKTFNDLCRFLGEDAEKGSSRIAQKKRYAKVFSYQKIGKREIQITQINPNMMSILQQMNEQEEYRKAIKEGEIILVKRPVGRPRKPVDPSIKQSEKRSVGRPKKLIDSNALVLEKRPVGRPRKPIDPNAPPVIKRPVGRPRKPIDPNSELLEKRPVGRPRKMIDPNLPPVIKRPVGRPKNPTSDSEIKPNRPVGRPRKEKEVQNTPHFKKRKAGKFSQHIEAIILHELFLSTNQQLSASMLDLCHMCGLLSYGYNYQLIVEQYKSCKYPCNMTPIDFSWIDAIVHHNTYGKIHSVVKSLESKGVIERGFDYVFYRKGQIALLSPFESQQLYEQLEKLALEETGLCSMQDAFFKRKLSALNSKLSTLCKKTTPYTRFSKITKISVSQNIDPASIYYRAQAQANATLETPETLLQHKKVLSHLIREAVHKEAKKKFDKEWIKTHEEYPHRLVFGNLPYERLYPWMCSRADLMDNLDAALDFFIWSDSPSLQGAIENGQLLHQSDTNILSTTESIGGKSNGQTKNQPEI